MSMKKRTNPAIWAGLMGIGAVSVPSCAYAATASASSGLPYEFVVGAAVGILTTAGAIAVFLKWSRRRRQAKEQAEERTAVVGFSMPVGDDVQVTDADAFMMRMTPKDQVASQRQVERLALGIEGEFAAPIAFEHHDVPAEKTVEGSRSVREVLLERLDDDDIGELPVIEADEGWVGDADTDRWVAGLKGSVKTNEGQLEPAVASRGTVAMVTNQFQVAFSAANAATASAAQRGSSTGKAVQASVTAGSRATASEPSMAATEAAARVPKLTATQAAQTPPAADAQAGKAASASPHVKPTGSAATPEMRMRAAIIAQRVPKVCPERRLSTASADTGKKALSSAKPLSSTTVNRAAARRRALDRVAMAVALNAAVSRRLVAAVRADERQSRLGPTGAPLSSHTNAARLAARHAHDESEMPTESLLTREKELHEDLGLAS